MDTTDGELETRLGRARLGLGGGVAGGLARLRLAAALARHVAEVVVVVVEGEAWKRMMMRGRERMGEVEEGEGEGRYVETARKMKRRKIIEIQRTASGGPSHSGFIESTSVSGQGKAK